MQGGVHARSQRGAPKRFPAASAGQVEVSVNSGESILVLAPTGNDGRLAAEFLVQAGFQAEICNDTAQLSRGMERGCGAILLAEEVLDSDAVAILTEFIARQPSWSDIPIVIVTSGAQLSSTRLHRLVVLGSDGNVTFIERPFHPATLVSTFQVALRSRRRQYQVRDLLQEREQTKADLEATIMARTMELQATITSLESLLYSIAHDLRSPLRAMQGFAVALEHDYQSVLDDVGREFTRRISLAAIRMDALTMDLLSFGQVANADLSLGRTCTLEVLEEALEQTRGEIDRTHAQIELVQPLANVWANPTVLQQILANLLSNALKYVAAGTIPHVRIWTEATPSVVRLSVQDNGIGIDPRYHAKVFKLFERLHRTAEYTGTGIGLAIVQKGIEKMGGHVGVTSEVGRGSTFWIELRPAE